METWDVIRARRNVRQSTDQPIPRRRPRAHPGGGPAVAVVVELAAGHFVVVTDREQLVELAKAWERGGAHIARSAATSALVAQQPEDKRTRQHHLRLPVRPPPS